MTESNSSQIPQIRPTQFETDVSGVFNDSVNLFRGDVNLSLDLISLKGRNGLDIKVTAAYGSNVKSNISNSNVNAPTGVMGLGWSLPFDRIEVESRDNASLNDNIYYLYTNNSPTELIMNNSGWERSSLPESASSILSQGRVDEMICSSFLNSGLALDIDATVEIVSPDKTWEISDKINQRVFRVESMDSKLVVFAGGYSFESFQYDFSQIIYYPGFERWELVKDDGISYFYGGSDFDRNPIQWRVRWGNWSGASALTSDADGTSLQRRFASAWNLMEVKNNWGDLISFKYDVVEQQVGQGGLFFTKACYISSITDMFDRIIDFNYGEKRYVINDPAGPREYMSPHWNDPYTKIPDNKPGPYQDKYETKYLDNIKVINSEGIMLYTVMLGYDDASNFSNYEKDNYLFGDTVKRTLTKIQRVFTDNCMTPSLDFSYWPSDSINAGAMGTALTPDGATISYDYKKQTIPHCDRQHQIVNPWPRTGKPRVWFGSDYVVNLWLNKSTDQIHVTLYTWLGRWQKWVPTTQIIKAAFDINSVNVLTSDDFACLTYTTTQSMKSYVHVFHKDNRKWGEWIETPTLSASTSNLGVAVGDNFFITCDRDNRVLMRYTWDKFDKKWIIKDVSDSLSGGDPNGKVYVTAANKHYGVLDYGPYSGGEHRNRLSLYFQDSGSQWHEGGSKELVFTIGGYKPEDSFGFTTSSSFMALTYITKETSLSFDYNVKIIGWNEFYNDMTDNDFAYTLPKSNPSQEIRIVFIAQFVNNSMVASGPNLLRYNGKTWLKNSSLDFRDTISDPDVNWFAYGEDYAIFTSNRENAVESRLAGYDPVTDIESWDTQSVELYKKDGRTPERKRHYFPTAGADIATMGNRVYSRGSQTNWENAVGSYQELSNEIDTTTMINQGPRFISYLNIDGTKAKYTTVYPLPNQFLGTKERIDERYFTQIKTDGLIKANTNGQFPGGLSTFVTYLPLNKDFDDADTITLNRYLDNTIQGELVDFCVEAMHINNGYTTDTTRYEFDIETATCDPTGAVFKYYTSKFYPGNGSAADPAFGYTENRYFNGLTRENTKSDGVVLKESEEAWGLLDGQLIDQKVFDANARLLVREQKEIHSFTSVIEDGKTVGLFGGYTRCIASTSINDGLEIKTGYEYESRFGKIIKEEFDNITADNNTETITKHYNYAFEAYDWFMEKNVIDSPFFEYETVTSRSQEVGLISGSLQQYDAQKRFFQETEKEAPTVWGTTDAYVLKADIPLSDLSINKLIETKPGPAWQQVNHVIERTFHGLIVAQEDVTAQVEATFWDKNEILPVATFTGPGKDTCDFIGFEPYETLSSWQLSTGIELSKNIVTGDAYTGICSLNLAAGNTLEKKKSLNQVQTTVVSAWIKAKKGFLSDSGSISLEVKTGTQPVEKFNVEPDAEDKWVYWQAVISYNSDTPRDIEISFANNKTSAGLGINNIAIAPLESEMAGRFYDNIYSDEIATMGHNADVNRFGYDPVRQKFAQAGPWKSMKQCIVNYTPREWENSIPFIYPKENPGASLDIMAADGGLYETFTNGDQIWNDWDRDNQNAWETKGGRLCHLGSDLNIVKWLSTQNTSSYAVGFTLSSPDKTGISFGITVGDGVSASWAPDRGWQMVLDGATHTDTETNGKVPCTILLVPVKGAVLLFADGRKVFAVKTSTIVSGEFSLSAKGALSFSNLFTSMASQISMMYKDANRREIQSQVLNDTQSLVNASIYNRLGNCVAKTRIASFDNSLLGFRSSFVTGLDKATGEMTGEVSDFYPEDEGYPYNGTLYEASSLGRPIKKGLPGKAFAIRDTNPNTTGFAYGVTDQDKVAGITFQDGKFLVTSVTDSNGSIVFAIKDRRDQTLGKQTNEGKTRLNAVQQVFDGAGNISRILHPNYFSGKDDADAFITENRYNFLRQLISRTTIDSGKTEYIYDQAGRVRFSSTPATLEKGRVLYKKYDILGRIYEEGEVAHEWGDGSKLQDIADTDPGYPHDNAWETLNSYDGEGEKTLRGRLWKTKKRSASNEIVENTYGYDLNGNATQCILNIQDQQPFITGYKYNNLGNITCVDYPDTAPVPQVVYTYNSMGQNTFVGTQDQLDKFATYVYQADGGLVEEKLNKSGVKPITRSISYNSPGWITEINNQYGDGEGLLKHNFTYTSGGYENAGYFNGNIASASTENSMESKNSFTYRFRYDHQGRMDVAEHTVNKLYSLGLGDRLSFDPNGNILDMNRGETVYSYQYQPKTNRVKTVLPTGGVEQTYDYDIVGNITGASYRDISSISYNNLNNLPVSTEKKDGSTLNFAYNGINQRVKKTSGDESKTIYVHGFNDAPLLETIATKGSGESIQYIYGVGGLMVMVKEGETNYILKDQQGSVRAVVGGDGVVKAMMDFMPFGQLIAGSVGNPDIIHYWYTGQEIDLDLGLYNYLARFYDPELGRFYSCDPKFQYATPYFYCNNNPVNQTDPSGEIATILTILLVSAAVGAAVGAGTAAYTGVKAGLKGGDLAGYIFAGAGIGAAAGALSAAGGVGAFAAGSAAAAAASTTAGGIAAGIAAGAGVGAVTGAAIGGAQGVSQHFVNDAFGVGNSGTWQQSLLSGAVNGAIGGAISGGVSGLGGAMAVQQSARYLQITGNNGWAYSPRSLTQVSEAYSSFNSMGVIPLPSIVSRIPNYKIPLVGGLQSFVLGKFSLRTISSPIASLAKQAVTPMLPTSNSSANNDGTNQQKTPQSNMSEHYSSQSYNPAMSGSIGMESALVMNPSYWQENDK